MRTVLFFDGKNFYSGWKDRAGGRPIQFEKLADWLVAQAGGSVLWGAYYYTGIETGPEAASEGQRKLSSFLDERETDRGFFVKRFPRKTQTTTCRACGAVHRFTQEKEVDTTMVADMLSLAAVSAFDIAVLVSGDADHAPAVEGVRTLGRKIYVATWGGYGLSHRIRKAAFHHIDMLHGLSAFELAPARLTGGPAVDVAPSASVAVTTAISPAVVSTTVEQAPASAATDAFLEELTQAETRFSGGYVGLNFFLTKWRSARLDSSPDVRRRILDVLRSDGRVEVYAAPDGAKGLRTKW